MGVHICLSPHWSVYLSTLIHLSPFSAALLAALMKYMLAIQFGICKLSAYFLLTSPLPKQMISANHWSAIVMVFLMARSGSFSPCEAQPICLEPVPQPTRWLRPNFQ